MHAESPLPLAKKISTSKKNNKKKRQKSRLGASLPVLTLTAGGRQCSWPNPDPLHNTVFSLPLNMTRLKWRMQTSRKQLSPSLLFPHCAA